jgi:DNA-binding LacI/PurR family transcriptional regulator
MPADASSSEQPAGRAVGRPPRVTLKDVAQLAGVSAATASHALRGNGNVAADTALRVREVAEQVGYRPNRTAANLRRQRSSSIGFIVPTIANPFLSELAEALYAECRHADYTLLCGTTNNEPALQTHYLDLFLGHSCDGIIVGGQPDRLDDIVRAGVPAVLVDCHTPSDFVQVPVVEVEDMHGMYSAVAHLVRLGHKRIGLVYGPQDQLRQEGYRRALEDAGIAFEADLAEDAVELRVPDARSAASRLFDRHPDVTAIAATTDVLALGVLRAALEAGRTVPADLAVVGFDGIPLSEAFSPPLTTVAQPVERIAATAVELLVEQIESGTIALDRRRVMLPTQLIVRESCGARLAEPG